mgnify:CR=1 FL=1
MGLVRYILSGYIERSIAITLLRSQQLGIFAHAVVLTSYVECLTWVRINGHSVIDSGVDGKPTILNFAFPELMLFRSRLPLGF